jgi:hypothetical protein
MDLVMLATFVVCASLLLIALLAVIFDLDDGFDAASLVSAATIQFFAAPVLSTSIAAHGISYAVSEYPTLSFGGALTAAIALFSLFRIVRRIGRADDA